MSKRDCERMHRPKEANSGSRDRGAARIQNARVKERCLVQPEKTGDGLPCRGAARLDQSRVSPRALRIKEHPIATVASASVGERDGLTSIRSMATRVPVWKMASQM